MEHSAHPDDLDWFRQRPQSPAHTSPDPVRTVWQLPRFRLGRHRFTGRVDHALVCVTRNGTYETFTPPHRPTSVRRYVALYEVDTDPQAFQLIVPLPSLIDSFEFEATADIAWRVADPALLVRSQERDVPGLLTRMVLPVLRAAGRDYAIEASAAAEEAVQRAVNGASWLGEEQGLRMSCSVRLRRDETERHHQARLRTARHEAAAAQPEHEASAMRQAYEADRVAERIRFYEHHLAQGDFAALALHLAVHPEDTQAVLGHLRDGQARLAENQLHLIDQALDSKRLEDHHLDEPHQLIAERMTAILRAASPSDQPSRPHPAPLRTPPATETAPSRAIPENGT
ncbi:hypothetical protein AB0O68_12505 [Streptomyces sp. NPDC087512]|uniref:hypothetical protein n=1 Tax=Streptomyces sp. NPDC087512 TaxID=3155059 RepID=UPI003448030B